MWVAVQKGRREEEEGDDHEQFMQRLDELDRELEKTSSSRSRATSKVTPAKDGPLKDGPPKRSSRSSQGAIDDLFDSDDEWANEGLESKGGNRKGAGNSFNPRQDPNLDRWAWDEGGRGA